MLLVSAAVIAAAGVIADSEATVIGAMLVAPLRIPILGTTLAVVLGDRLNLQRAVALIVAGALVTVGIGFLLGLTVVYDLTSLTNGQVATWSHAALIDLLAPSRSVPSGPSRCCATTSPTQSPAWRSPCRWCRRSPWSASPWSQERGATPSAPCCCSGRTSRPSWPWA